MIASLHTVSESIIEFFQKHQKESLRSLNKKLQQKTGIVTFIKSEEDFEKILAFCKNSNDSAETSDRAEYGDFQTNETLTDAICEQLQKKKAAPTLLIEPTFGKGNFILSALKKFKSLKRIVGIEIYKPYVYATQFRILEYYIETDELPIEIVLYHDNFFTLDLGAIKVKKSDTICILGNPPWVTNSKLSTLNSTNLPKKSNFKKHSGMLAMTGKGDFDIGEYITLKLLDHFSHIKGYMSFLIKNSVIKNLTQDQVRNTYTIATLEKWQIDAKKEFKAHTDASIFFCSLNAVTAYTIKEYDFYTQQYLKTSGWVDEKFVANIEDYSANSIFDGKCSFTWRSGVKHDCSKVMEFQKTDTGYINKLKTNFSIEDAYVYRILKSSDVKNKNATPNRFTIITQKKVGQDTSQIQENAPRTYQYLEDHKDFFQKRKSSIYKNKPDFSIFGIGDYSFYPYKVAIASMYKKFEFMLVASDANKCRMVDDTCYFIGFDTLIHAQYCTALLNHPRVQAFIQSLAFADTQRVIHKGLLDRIDLIKIATTLGSPNIQGGTVEAWEAFLELIAYEKDVKRVGL